MGAPKGNKFWELRSKHGRDKLFKTPELLWQAACEYFQWIEDNPLIQIDFKGKDATEVEIPHTRPYTIQGLCLYLDCNVMYFNDFEYGLAGKKDQLSKDFSIICTRIRDTIYKQKYEGASCGFYNHNIIARDLGLAETVKATVSAKQEVTVSTTEAAKQVQNLIDKFESE